MKTRTIEDWRITQLFIELEKRVESHRESARLANENSNWVMHNIYRGRWQESQDALSLVRSFLEESEDIEESMKRSEK